MGWDSSFYDSTERSPGYLDRITTLLDNAKSYPLSTQGFVPPNYCSDDSECESKTCARETSFSYEQCLSQDCASDDQCKAGRCDAGTCLPKLGSCMECDENSDCASGTCLLFKCANLEGKMDDECRCEWDTDCDSGRCEGFVPPMCEAALPEGSGCDEHSDCLSNNCNWWFQCSAEDILGVGPSSDVNVFSARSVVLVASVAASFVAYEYVGRRRRSRGYTLI